VLSFTPTGNYNGVSSIRYTVEDNLGSISNTATVTITVNAVNDLPVASADNATTDQGVAININVLANDSDDNGLSAGSVDLNTSQAGIQNSFANSAGNFTASSSGVVTFSPTATFSGPTSITYTVDDSEGGTSNAATISITVNYINQTPVANNDGVTTDEDIAVTVNVVANDTDDGTINPGSVDLNVSLAGIQTSRSTPAGTWTVSATGVVTFTPTANFNGAGTLTYRVNDNLGVTSNNATITITINPVNDSPVSVADSKATNEDVPTTITVLTNDSDTDNAIQASTVDLDPGTAGIQTSIDRVEGTWSVNTSGVVTFTPVANFFGTATNTYTVNDIIGATSNAATITISVTSVNDVPIAVNDQASTPQNQSVTFNVTANDLDVDGTINVATVDLDPILGGRQTSRVVASGTFTVDNSGNVTFVPIANFNGSAGIQYSVQDNFSAVSTAGSITVLVNFVNSAPIANDDNVSTNEDTPVNFAVLTNDTDDGTFAPSTVDLNPSVAGVQNTISTGSGRFDVSTSGVVTFTPGLNFNGSSTASYTVNDNIGATSNVAMITVTINPVNDAAVAVNDNANTNEDVAVSINVLSNDSDIEGTLDPASVDLDTSTPAIESTRTTAQGTFTANLTNGIVTYTPLANFNGTATLTYTIQDNLGLRSNIATITVTVANINDAPTFAVIPDQVVLRNSATKSITITGISPGPQETEQIVLTTQSTNTPVVPNPTIVYNGTATTAALSFKPQPNQFGTATITVKAFDSGLTEFSRSFTITVVDARITSTPVTTAVKGELYQYDLQTTPLDPTLTFVVTQKPAWATITSTGKNTATLSGTPPATAPLSSLVIVQLREGATVIDEQQFTIVLNQRPVVAPFAIETNEDNGLPLPIEKFVEAFTDPDNDPIDKIVITQLPDPARGVLRLNNEPVVVGEPIPIALVTNIVYLPVLDSSGVDEFWYRAGDQRSLSDLAAPVTITINPVNDAPVITSLETEPLNFDIGLELAQIFTAAIDVKDADRDKLQRVEIGFRRPNFDELHDVLEFNNTATIRGDYDSDAGILTLSGEASVEDYVQALRTIEYNFVDIETVDNLKRLEGQSRTVYIRVSDGMTDSDERERVINFEYTLIPLSIPNAFAPGSMNYATWRIREKGDYATVLTQYPDAEIFVFDKRGQIVFKTVGFEREWDGTLNGNPLPVDTYFYVINLNYGGVQYKGTVTIFREK
jgi:gliding motility-associated-like protein